jgi:LuxR family maltose regulon positive regulatory protein
MTAAEDAVPGFAAVAQGDFAEAAHILQQARTLVESAPGELARSDYEILAAYVALHDQDLGECHRLLARSLAASPLASQAFARFPTQMVELCKEALTETAMVRELVSRYRVRSSGNLDRARVRTFQVFVLGRFRVIKDGAPIRFSRRAQRKPLELLQALIAQGGVEIGASTLTDALWPDSEGDAAYHALESALYRLRQLLGAPSAVSMAGGKLTLDRRQFWVDMWAFEGELQAGSAGHRGAGERLARMRKLYAGHFLAQEAEKPWALEKRQILREKFVHAIRDIAHDYEARRLWQEAAGVYQVGIEVDSLAEDLHRGLMTCHRELGDHVAAVQAFRRCSQLLTEVLGLPPSSKTRALYHSVRHEAASPAA